MNILYFHTHDSGRYFRHYGYADAPTEYLSRWALGRAVTFRNAFSCSPTCSPSRASLLTGTYPHTNGMHGLAHRGFRMNDYGAHFVPFLKQHGYHTVLCGVQHEAAACFDHARGAAAIGYAENITANLVQKDPGVPLDGDTTLAWDRENTSRAAEWLCRRREAPGEAPFFLSLGLYATHREYPSLSKNYPEAVPQPPDSLDLPDTEETRKDHARFLEALRSVDENFSKAIKALEQSDQDDSTIILVTTDHGVAQPFSKCNLNTRGQGVALMIRVPGAKPLQPFCDALVSTVDVFPTLADLVGLETPPAVQGRSFSQLFREPDAAHREYVFGEVNFHTSYEPMRSIRNRRYNLVRNYDRQYPYTHASNIDNSPAKSALLDRGLAGKKKAPIELYDLKMDPFERNNVIDEPRYHETADLLKRMLANWQIETEDPLLRGRVMQPAGSIVNRPECVDPESSDPGDYVEIDL